MPRRHDGPPRPKPIRYDADTWLVMRNDPVLPEAIITRQQTPDRREYFRAVTWDLDPRKRMLIGRYPDLQSADEAVNYPVGPNPGPKAQGYPDTSYSTMPVSKATAANFTGSE